MKTTVILFVILLAASCTINREKAEDKTDDNQLKTVLTKEELQDKIKGGWAGQVIGCTFGGPTEFRFKGSMINDYQPIPWDEDRCLWYFENAPGLYDDVYMDLTFVDVFEKEGMDAPASSHALAFAHAGYKLWHANQAARYNVLNGIMPPESGHWMNNPHADDIDFQIEADFAGLMAPGMVNYAAEICDKIGHIMNYGDGWYGGVYVAAMYSMAFIANDIGTVVKEALNAIPEESGFYQCMDDVIKWHSMYPDDWKRTWFEVEKKWSADIGCPNGVYSDFNIDARINAAYILIGLLYGEGDYSKTLEISTRCGQDSDCNPASAGGILGTLMGYDRIPDFWKKPVQKVEAMNFKYTTMSLDVVYETGMKHALAGLMKKGAEVDGSKITIPFEPIKPVQLEIGFQGHYPKLREHLGNVLNSENSNFELEFEGKGIVITGKASGGEPETAVELEMIVDDGAPVNFSMPVSFEKRRNEVAWKYGLPEGKHRIAIRMINPQSEQKVELGDQVVYSGINVKNAWKK